MQSEGFCDVYYFPVPVNCIRPGRFDSASLCLDCRALQGRQGTVKTRATLVSCSLATYLFRVAHHCLVSIASTMSHRSCGF